MKLLVVSKVPIFPVTGGNRSRIKTFCDEARALGHDISFLLLPSKDRGFYDEKQHRTYFGDKSFYIINRHMLLSTPFLIATLVRREIGRMRHCVGWPQFRSNNVDYRFDDYLIIPLRKAVAHIKPDVLVIEYVHFSKIALLAPKACLKIIDTHDSFEHEFTSHAEGTGLCRADLIIAIQQMESDRFREMVGDKAKVHVVSHIIPKMTVVDTSHCEGFSFVGSDFDANNVSLKWLFDEVLPIIVKQRPNCRLFTAGTVGNTLPDDDRVVKLGKVDNLYAIYSKAPILANAICKGTGIKIKLLEAMASGVSVVSTRLGVAGINERFLASVAVVNDSDAYAFADQIIRLFDDESARRFAGQRALTDMTVWNKEQRRALAGALSTRAAL